MQRGLERSDDDHLEAVSLELEKFSSVNIYSHLLFIVYCQMHVDQH